MAIAFTDIQIGEPDASKLIESKRHPANFDVYFPLSEMPTDKWREWFDRENHPAKYPGYVEFRLREQYLVVECNLDNLKQVVVILESHIHDANDIYREKLALEEQQESNRRAEIAKREDRLQEAKRFVEALSGTASH